MSASAEGLLVDVVGAGAVGNTPSGSSPSAPFVATIRFLAGFQPASTGLSSSM
jgi:hypothetical protein